MAGISGYVYDDVADNCRDLHGVLIPWLIEIGILGDYSVDCQTCLKGKLGLRKDTSLKLDECTWRCSNKKCGFKVSIRRHSWIEKVHLSLAKIAKLVYFWTYKYSQEVVARELRIGSGHTVVDWYNFCHEI